MAIFKDRYDFEPNPEVRTFTPDLDGLIAFLETQNGVTEYEWYSVTDCLFCRFAAERGEARSTYLVNPGVQKIGGIGAYHAIGSVLPWTYAAALTRARALRDRVSA